VAVYKIDDKFTSSSSDDYDNDSDFIQHVVLGGYTSYASLMDVADSDNVASWMALKDSCATILDASTYSEFDVENQSIIRTTNWPADSANDSTYHDNYRAEIGNLNTDGAFKTIPYVRRTIRMGNQTDSDGNNWGMRDDDIVIEGGFARVIET